MAFSRLVFTVLLISVSCYASNVPVFMWGDKTTPIKANPLEVTTTGDFADIFERVLPRNSFTVIFVEQTLSPEDISSKNPDGTSLFPYLAQQAKTGRSIYLSAVDSPVQAIDESVDQTKVDFIHLFENEPVEIKSSNSKYLFINLKDAKEGESREDMLERHNKFMKDTIEQLKKSRDENIVGVYTGLNPSWMISNNRVRRQAADSNETLDYILDGVRMYVELVQLKENGVAVNLTSRPTSSMSNDAATRTMNTTVNFNDHSFVMNFRNKGGYWYFDSVTFQGVTNETLYPATQDLFALMGFSYRCAQKTVFNNVFSNSSTTLTFNNLQIQPFFGPINETHKFGNTFDCVGFFSGPILSGLMVTFILLAITFYGIMMMMDIKTMDRFDDPKGKTITINASE